MRLIRMLFCFWLLRLAQWIYPDSGYVACLLHIGYAPIPVRQDAVPLH